MIKVNVKNGVLSENEVKAYTDKMRELHPDIKDGELSIEIDGDYVDCTLIENTVKFQRIRRITGYLVGTLDRFNDAKRHEVDDRVKHSMGDKTS